VDGETVISIPAALQKAPPCLYAWCFVVSEVE